MKVLELPVAAPGKCVICGSVGGDGRKFVDFGFDIDYYGVVYFCENCMTEVMEVLSYVHASKFNALKDDYTAKVNELEAALKRIKVLDDALRDAFGIESDKLDGYASPGGSLPDTDEVSQASIGDSEFSVEPESNADESSNIEGSISVHNAPKRSSKSRTKSTDLGF